VHTPLRVGIVPRQRLLERLGVDLWLDGGFARRLHLAVQYRHAARALLYHPRAAAGALGGFVRAVKVKSGLPSRPLRREGGARVGAIIFL